MKCTNDFTPEIIKCPSCGFLQAAIVEHTAIFPTFLHQCIECNYVIMESEWETIKPFKQIIK